MEKIVIDIYRGNFSALGRRYPASAKQHLTFDKIEALEDVIKTVLPEEYHALLKQYNDLFMEMMDACCEDDFVAGYGLGVRMILAAWQSGYGFA